MKTASLTFVGQAALAAMSSAKKAAPLIGATAQPKTFGRTSTDDSEAGQP